MDHKMSHNGLGANGMSSICLFNLFIYLGFYLFIWGFTSLSTLYRSYHDG